MFNQKLHSAESVEFGIAEEPRYEIDPCELKLAEMIDAEPEPEMIEGLPASDALTPPIVILNCLNTFSHRVFLPIAKHSRTVRRKWIRSIF
jgi:neutral trehalase